MYTKEALVDLITEILEENTPEFQDFPPELPRILADSVWSFLSEFDEGDVMNVSVEGGDDESEEET